MPTTTKKMEQRLADRVAALESEVYEKRTDAAYFDFWNEAVWIMAAAIVGMAIALAVIVWIKG